MVAGVGRGGSKPPLAWTATGVLRSQKSRVGCRGTVCDCKQWSTVEAQAPCLGRGHRAFLYFWLDVLASSFGLRPETDSEVG